MENTYSLYLSQTIVDFGSGSFPICCVDLDATDCSVIYQYMVANSDGLGNGAYWCLGIRNIQNPEYIQTIEKNAFTGNTGLAQTEFPGVTRIEDEAFASFTRPSGAQIEQVFDALSIPHVDADYSLYFPACEYLGSKAFYSANAIKDIYFGDTVPSLGVTSTDGMFDIFNNGRIDSTSDSGKVYIPSTAWSAYYAESLWAFMMDHNVVLSY